MGSCIDLFVLEAIESGSCLAKNQHFPAAVCEQKEPTRLDPEITYVSLRLIFFLEVD